MTSEGDATPGEPRDQQSSGVDDREFELLKYELQATDTRLDAAWSASINSIRHPLLIVGGALLLLDQFRPAFLAIPILLTVWAYHGLVGNRDTMRLEVYRAYLECRLNASTPGRPLLHEALMERNKDEQINLILYGIYVAIAVTSWVASVWIAYVDISPVAALPWSLIGALAVGAGIFTMIQRDDFRNRLKATVSEHLIKTASGTETATMRQHSE